jgi:hypothetical protein
MDKHRLLPFTEVRVKRVVLVENPEVPVIGFRGYKGRMKVGAVLARFKPADSSLRDKVKVKIVLIPIFGEKSPEAIEGQSAVNSVVHARNFIVSAIIPAFRNLP